MASAESRQIRATLSHGTPDAPVEQGRREWEAAVSGVVLDASITRAQADVAGMPAEWVMCSKEADAGRTILLVHGGGFSAGSFRTHRGLAAHIAEAAAARVLTINYRLAPEAPFPAALDDVITAYRWLLATGQAPGLTAFVGDSAGAALALGALLRLRDAGKPLPAAVALISPWVDLSLSGPTIQSHAARDPLTSFAALQAAAQRYLDGQDAREPLASPLFGDLHRLPSLLVQAGGDEILLSDATRLAERALLAGVDVELAVWEGMWHVWHAWAPALPEANAAIAQLGRFLRLRWRTPA